MTDMFLKIALLGDTWVLWLLMAASVLSLAVMADRWWAFSSQSGDLSALMDGLAEKLEAHDLKGAEALAATSKRVEARVALEGLRNFAKGPASVEEVMSSRWLRERLNLDKRLIILSTLGNNAPFVGLFGTVLGIIKAFNDLAASGQSGVAVVMAGISAALIATAFGILVAIPAVVANNYFVSRLRQMQANTESLSKILLAYLKSERREA
jgi:biopolymer transport protein ExbB/TolQ